MAKQNFRIGAPLHKRAFNRQRRYFVLMGISTAIASACTRPAGQNALSMATKRISHALGETDVPVRPTRIVVVGYFTVEAMMALGVQPIAAPAVITDNLLHLPTVEGAIADIGVPNNPNLEKIAALNPDLILTSKLFAAADTYPLLSQIAPTVVLDANGHSEWQALTRLCAETLGKETEAEQLKADYEAKLQAFKSQVNASQLQVSVASFHLEQITTYGRESFIGTVLDAAGLSRPPNQREGRNAQISIELLNEIDGDVLFVMNPQSQTELAGDVRAALEKIKTNPLWNTLNAVQNNQVYEVDTYWFGVGYIAADRVLDDLAQYVSKG
ncbi:MAG: iron-siderophore ABC transporter substrate-binding protein [Cyanobacteria bacterium P01_H01_bin.21]